MSKKTTPQNPLSHRIKTAIEGADMTYTAIGEAIGVTRSAVSQWVSPKGTEPTPENLRAIAMATGVSYDWLATGRAHMSGDMRSEDVSATLDRPGRRMLKVKGYVGANGTTGYYAVNQGDLNEIEASANDPPTAVAVEIMGTSLGRFFDRWYAIYSDVRAPVTDDLDRKLCVVGLEDGRVLIKELRKNGSRYELHSNDQNEPPIKGVKIEWAAKVTDVRQK